MVLREILGNLEATIISSSGEVMGRWEGGDEKVREPKDTLLHQLCLSGIFLDFTGLIREK
jgi:hypothetical protein